MNSDYRYVVVPFIIKYQYPSDFTIIPSCSLLLACLREAADPFHVADDAGEVVEVFAVANGTFVEITLIDVAAVVADGVGDVKGEVVAALLRGHAEQLAILGL